jgi:hypothetical protein
MNNNIKKDSGAALVGSLLLMIILLLLGQAMIFTSRQEIKNEVRSRMGDTSLYIAEAGVERAIVNMNNDLIIDFSEQIGSGTGGVKGAVEVNLTNLGDTYQIDSTGYVPSTSSPRFQRTLRVVVKINPGLPEQAISIGGVGNISSNVTVKGAIFSEGPLTVESNVDLVPDDNGNCALYSASEFTTADVEAGIEIATNFEIDPSNETTTEEIRVRGEVDGNEAGDPNGDNVVGDPPIYENDTSNKTESKGEDISFLDETALLASVTHVDHTFGGAGVPDANGTMVFSDDIDLNSGVYLYTAGVVFEQAMNISGQGTIVVCTSTVNGGNDNADYGIEMRQNIFGPDPNTYAEVNLIVLDGDWGVTDVKITQNIMIRGLIQGAADINVSSNVDVKGIMIAGGNLDVSSNIDVEYEEPVFAVPSKESAGVTFISWEDLGDN